MKVGQNDGGNRRKWQRFTRYVPHMKVLVDDSRIIAYLYGSLDLPFLDGREARERR
jgi:hypothetical protein